MQLREIRVDDQITHIALVGKLDIQGMHQVDIRFHGYTAARRKPALVDLSGLDFIASLAMGMFISCANSLRRHGAKMVLLDPQPAIEESLTVVGLHQAIPIAHGLDEAMRLLFGDQPK
jgi:anti-anti-sigma factor